MQGIRKALWDEVWCQTKGGLRRVGLGWHGGGVRIADTEVSLLTAHGDHPWPSAPRRAPVILWSWCSSKSPQLHYLSGAAVSDNNASPPEVLFFTRALEGSFLPGIGIIPDCIEHLSEWSEGERCPFSEDL